MPKKKCYVLIISEYFPAKHPRRGQSTHFEYHMRDVRKRHTIRKNFPLWKDRVEKVNKGEAYISVRTWTDEPYIRKQEEIGTMNDSDVQHLIIKKSNFDSFDVTIDGKSYDRLDNLAHHDGLDQKDFIDWFFNPLLPDEIFDGAIIHFTDMKY